MKVVILCGGMGMRLRAATVAVPKPLVEIGDRPILWHVMRTFAHYGFSEFVLALGYKGGVIKQYFVEHKDYLDDDCSVRFDGRGGQELLVEGSSMAGWRIDFVDTGLYTNTGGRLRRLRHKVPEGTFLCTYADGLTDLRIPQLLDFHRRHGKLATVTTVQPRDQFGRLVLDPDGLVTRFEEKPARAEWINAGYFVFEREVLERCGEDEVLESDVLPRLVADRQLVAYRHTGFWACMDTFKDQKTLDEMCVRDTAPWRAWRSGAEEPGSGP